MKYVGKMYRPWMEADSALLQVTIGCSNNECTFCTMFDDKKFKTRPIEDVFKDIEDLKRMYGHVDSMFLTDGNVMVLKTSYLLKVIAKIKEEFPGIQNIALYSQYTDLVKKSVEDLTKLRVAGLDKAYIGLESGDEKVLMDVHKKMTREDAIEGARRAKEAGIEVLASYIFGLGGKERSLEHAKATTDLINLTKPEELAPMALAVQPGSELEREIEEGKFTLATPKQVLEEEKYLLENLEDFPMYYWGDHGNNIVPQRGLFPEQKEKFLQNVNEAFRTNPKVNTEILRTFAW